MNGGWEGKCETSTTVDRAARSPSPVKSLLGVIASRELRYLLIRLVMNFARSMTRGHLKVRVDIGSGRRAG